MNVTGVLRLAPELDDIFTDSGHGARGGRVKMADVRNNWEGRTVNEIFPLRRFLGSSNHSTVFLTESSVEGFLNAAIKLVPVVDPRQIPAQM